MELEEKNFENPPYIKSCVLKCRLEILTLFLILPNQKFEKSSNDCQSCRKHEFLHVIELLIKILQKVDGKQTGSQENSGFLKKNLQTLLEGPKWHRFQGYTIFTHKWSLWYPLIDHLISLATIIF